MSTRTYEPYKTNAATRFLPQQRLFKFPNGRGASVVRGEDTYGGPQGLFELAVLDAAGELDYSTPVTGNVIGYLTEDEVQAKLAEIDALPAEDA